MLEQQARTVRGAAFVFIAVFLSATAAAQAPAAPVMHTVKRGESLSSIARQLRYPDVTLNQMTLALARANMQSLRARSVDRIAVGAILTIPDLSTVMATDPAAADREMGRLRRAEQYYREAVTLENRTDHKAAFEAYTEAGNLGHGLAEMRLGEIYDTGSPAVKRDLQESARWYQKAREHGVKVPEQRGRGPRERP